MRTTEGVGRSRRLAKTADGVAHLDEGYRLKADFKMNDIVLRPHPGGRSEKRVRSYTGRGQDMLDVGETVTAALWTWFCQRGAGCG